MSYAYRKLTGKLIRSCACLLLSLGFVWQGESRAFDTVVGGTKYQVINAFDEFSYAWGARAELIQASDGNLWSTTRVGGFESVGNVFEITPRGKMHMRYSFRNDSSTGKFPESGLVVGPDGFFYGTTSGGGADGVGTVYKVSPNGRYVLLHSFAADGVDGVGPYGGLVDGLDGWLYGTTPAGGTGNWGTAFRISKRGTHHQLASFDYSSAVGAEPRDTLIRGSDGGFYGTSRRGGVNDNGAIFRMSHSGKFKLIFAFLGNTNSEGEAPQGSLMETPDGAFYGVMGLGGAHGLGTIYKVSRTGEFTVVHHFAGKPLDGSIPRAGLIDGHDGYYYGTTSFGGTFDNGTVYRVRADGHVSVLHSMSVDEKCVVPLGAVVLAMDGMFYGTCSGDYGPYGGVFRLKAH